MHKIFSALALASAILLANDGHSHHHDHHAHHHGDGHVHKSIECITEVSKQKHKNPSLEVLEVMHAPMMCKKWVESGDVNKDYLENMIPHHMGAVLSSKALLKYTKNTQLKKIAKDIISAQEKEIAQFKELLASLSKQEVVNYEAFKQRAKHDMHKMMEQMQKVKNTSNVDKDFLAGMLIHHQGALDASKQILEVSKDDRIRKIAKDIISAQEKEIAQFKQLFKDIK